MLVIKTQCWTEGALKSVHAVLNKKIYTLSSSKNQI